MCLFLAVEIQSLKSADTCLRSKGEFGGMAEESFQPQVREFKSRITRWMRVTCARREVHLRKLTKQIKNFNESLCLRTEN